MEYFISQLMQFLIQFIGIVLMMAIGWYFGTRAERRHLAQLDEQEKLLGHIIVSSERFFVPKTTQDGKLVVGSVVVAQDYFKHIVARVLNLLGKNLTVFERLLERSRREAVVRLKREADLAGYNQVFGVRLQSSIIGGGVETIAYGTAINTLDNPKVPPSLPRALNSGTNQISTNQIISQISTNQAVN